MKKICLCLLSFFIFSHSWAFGKLTQQLKITFQKYNYNENFTNVSLFFENQSIGNSINSIELKKTIAKELLKNFRVVDPVITQQIASQNKWKKKDFLKKKNRMYFFQQTDSHVLIYTELTENEQRIFALHTIFQAEKGIIAELHQSFQKEPFLKTQTTNKISPEKTLFASISNDFFSQNSLEDIIPVGIQEPQDELFTQIFPISTRKNTNWIVHQPTAFFVQGHTIHQRFGIDNLEFVRLKPDFFRYSYGYANFEVSLNALEQAGSIGHSYFRIKTLLYNHGSGSPLFTVAGGLRTRLYRKNNNEQPKQDQAREDLSFFLALSGYPRTYILYNFYLDNYSIGLGAKLFLEKNFRLFLDSRIDYQQNDRNQYYSLGIELLPSKNIGYALSFSAKRDNIVQVKDAHNNTDSNEEVNANFSIIFHF